jgi:outer membrane protein TolC
LRGGRTRGKVIEERATLNQYEIALKDTEEKIRYEVRQAFLSLKDAEELINSQKENVKQAEEGLRLANIGFQNGVNTQLEVLDTQLALDVARKNYLSAIYSYNLAQLMMQKAMGVLRNKD